MPYRLVVTAGPSLDLSTHNLVQVNDDARPLEIQSPHFRGRITVRVKDFTGITSTDSSHAAVGDQLKSSSYFNNKTATFSLQCQGQYGDPVEDHSFLTADDIMFGIVLREPLNETPPLGLGLIERTMRFFWPIMESNLQDPTPWVLSPMFATMSRIYAQAGVDQVEQEQEPSLCSPAQKYFREALVAKRSRCELPPWPGIMPDAESENVLPFLRSRRTCRSRTSSLSSSPPPSPSLAQPESPVPSIRRSLFHPSSYFPRSPSTSPRTPPLPRTPKERKKYFSSPVTRKQTRIEPTDVITTDFRNSFIDFRDLSLAVPGVPFKIDLSRHMVGRPAQYVCRSRAGVVYWAIVFTIIEDKS